MRKTLSQLKKQHQQGEKLACLTAYDASFAHWAAEAEVDVLLVGDSLGMVVQGHDTTLPVTLDEMVYHTRLVQRGNRQRAWCVADLPFMSDASLESALQATARLIKEGGANMVKLEGGARVLALVEKLSQLGVPVCGHLGLLPQSVHKNGYRIGGKEVDAAEQLLQEALDLQAAGAEMLVLECVPSDLATKVTEQLSIPVIGIGAGARTSGQVLVLYDVLGITVGKLPKFSKNFLQQGGSVQQAMVDYVRAVKSGRFPEAVHEVA
jgi:3-methyl-2-oxobutanoate hydroxymethyltransferase